MTETTRKVSKLAKGGGMRMVYETLRREILELKLRPGVLLEETTLAQRFSMSRSPIREAIIHLSGDGLVEILPNRSTIVARFDLAEVPQYIEALDFMQRINTRLAARHRTQDDLKRIIAFAEAFDRACIEVDHLAMSQTNKEFHMAIAAAGKNRHLAQAYGKLLDEGQRILHMHFEFTRVSKNQPLRGDDHFRIIRALEEQDVQAADQFAHEHTRLFFNRIVEFMQANYFDDFDFSCRF